MSNGIIKLVTTRGGKNLRISPITDKNFHGRGVGSVIKSCGQALQDLVPPLGSNLDWSVYFIVSFSWYS